MRSFVAGLGVVLMLSAAGPALAQEPPPQFSVEDLQRDFSQPPGETCESQGMVTGSDGQCVATRGFSLTAPKSTTTKAAPAQTQSRRRPAAGSQTASLGAAPAPRVAGRDLLITFANNSAVLTPQARSNAKVFAEALKTAALRGLRFEISGHTNATGTRPANMTLSQQRAQALVDYLTSLGVDASRFEVRGFGFDRPINQANPRAGENRRVEARRLN